MTTLHYIPVLQVCSCCKEPKLLKDFYVDTYTQKAKAQCKQCTNIKRHVDRDKQRVGKFISKERIRGMDEPDYCTEDWKKAMLYFKGSCAFCGKPEGRAKNAKLDKDHILPISKGGKTTKYNIIPACRKCNRGRGNKDWLEWYQEQTFFNKDMARKIAKWMQGEANV